jgi:hypothetical protein
MVILNTNKIKKLPFKEIMEIINANNGFFYNKNSKKKLDRYAREVPRRSFHRSTRKSSRSSKNSRLLRA